MRILGTFAVAFLAIAALTFAAQDNTPPKVTLKSLPKTAKPGQVVKAIVVVEFAEGLHAYQNPPTADYEIPLQVACGTKGIAVKAKYPKGAVKNVNGAESAVYEGLVEVPIALTMPKRAGKQSIKLTVSYQQCNESTCFPPGKVQIEAKVDVKGGKPR